MKKLVTMFLLAVMSVSLIACGNSGDKNSENSQSGDSQNKKEVTAESLAEALVDGITYTGEIDRQPDEDLEWYIELEEGVTGVVYSVAGVSCEQVAVFKVPNDDAATKTIASLETLLADLKDQNAAYDAKVASRIENAVLEHKGDFVILCVSDDSAKAKEIIKEAFGK